MLKTNINANKNKLLITKQKTNADNTQMNDS